MSGADSVDWKNLLFILLQGNDYTLTTLELPEGLTRLHAEAITELLVCTEITLPSTLSYIDNWNFKIIPNLTTLIVNPITPPTMGSNAIATLARGAIVYVPDAAVDAYKAAKVWNTISDRIKPISELGRGNT